MPSPPCTEAANTARVTWWVQSFWWGNTSFSEKKIGVKEEGSWMMSSSVVCCGNIPLGICGGLEYSTLRLLGEKWAFYFKYLWRSSPPTQEFRHFLDVRNVTDVFFYKNQDFLEFLDFFESHIWQWLLELKRSAKYKCGSQNPGTNYWRRPPLQRPTLSPHQLSSDFLRAVIGLSHSHGRKPSACDI